MDKSTESILAMFYNSTRWSSRKDLSSQDNVLASSRVVHGGQNNQYWDDVKNEMVGLDPRAVLEAIEGIVPNAMYILALGLVSISILYLSVYTCLFVCC